MPSLLEMPRQLFAEPKPVQPLHSKGDVAPKSENVELRLQNQSAYSAGTRAFDFCDEERHLANQFFAAASYQVNMTEADLKQVFPSTLNVIRELQELRARKRVLLSIKEGRSYESDPKRPDRAFSYIAHHLAFKVISPNLDYGPEDPNLDYSPDNYLQKSLLLPKNKLEEYFITKPKQRLEKMEQILKSPSWPVKVVEAGATLVYADRANALHEWLFVKRAKDSLLEQHKILQQLHKVRQKLQNECKAGSVVA